LLLRDMVAVMGLTGDLRRALRLLGEASRLDERTTGTDAMLRIVRALVLTHMRRLRRAADSLTASGEPVGARSRQLMWWRVRSQIDRRAGRPRDAVAGALRAWDIGRAADTEVDLGPVLLDVACSMRDAADADCFAWYRTVLRHAHGPETAAVHSRAGLELAQWSGCWLFAGRAAARLAEAEQQLGDAPAALRHRHEAQSFYRRVDFPSPSPVDDAPPAHAVLTPTARGGWPRTRSQDHRRPCPGSASATRVHRGCHRHRPVPRRS